MSDDPRTMLAEAVKGRSDNEIVSMVKELGGGTEPSLDVIFAGMTTALDPSKAQDCVIGYVVKDGADTYSYRVIVKDKVCTYEKGEPGDARVTLTLELPNFMRLISGELDGMKAFMGGKLKLAGDMMFATQMQRMFNA